MMVAASADSAMTQGGFANAGDSRLERAGKECLDVQHSTDILAVPGGAGFRMAEIRRRTAGNGTPQSRQGGKTLRVHRWQRLLPQSGRNRLLERNVSTLSVWLKETDEVARRLFEKLNFKKGLIRVKIGIAKCQSMVMFVRDAGQRFALATVIQVT